MTGPSPDPVGTSPHTGTVRPYYDGGDIQLHHGDCREILPALGQRFDACLADPPYGETSLAWDRWPTGWLDAVAQVTDSLWCFGSMRMFVDHLREFDGWRLSQDVVWRKDRGTSFAADRLRRIHEHALHWYQGAWSEVHHAVPRIQTGVRYHAPQRQGRDGDHLGRIDTGSWVDDGTRLAQSVLDAPSVRGGLSPTQKPVPVVGPLLAYAVPPGGTVVDPMAGSCTTGIAARLLGLRAVLIEADEAQCEKAARRLDQGVLDLGGVAG